MESTYLWQYLPSTKCSILRNEKTIADDHHRGKIQSTLRVGKTLSDTNIRKRKARRNNLEIKIKS